MLRSLNVLVRFSQNPAFSTKVREVVPILGAQTSLIFRQLFEHESSTYTYLLADRNSRDAILIDPVLETVSRDAQVVKDLDFNLVRMLNTHVHADHITGTAKLKDIFPKAKSMIAKVSKAKADYHFEHGDCVKFGQFELECRSTPGHTDGCFSFVLHDAACAFTGDALLYRGCGRTDFQAGDSALLYKSVQTQLFSLPDCYLLFPAHDYRGHSVTSVEEEKRLNPRLTKSEKEFVKIMKELKLDLPKKIDESLPANMQCGCY